MKTLGHGDANSVWGKMRGYLCPRSYKKKKKKKKKKEKKKK